MGKLHCINYFCTKLTLFSTVCVYKKKNCTGVSQSESSNFVMYINHTFIFKIKYHFWPKLHPTQFNNHFITSIFIFTGDIKQSFETKVAKFTTDWFFCLSFSCNLIVYFINALKFDWLFCISVPFSLAGEKVKLRAANSAIWEKIASLKAIRLHGSPAISKRM